MLVSAGPSFRNRVAAADTFAPETSLSGPIPLCQRIRRLELCLLLRIDLQYCKEVKPRKRFGYVYWNEVVLEFSVSLPLVRKQERQHSRAATAPSTIPAVVLC
jgi:hypothetical protein